LNHSALAQENIMGSELATAVSSKGSLSVFVATHSVGLALGGGVLLGLGAYYYLSKRKKAKAAESKVDVVAEVAPA
jgi:LPXTG-motif cell wall-anchored protein